MVVSLNQVGAFPDVAEGSYGDRNVPSVSDLGSVCGEAVDCWLSRSGLAGRKRNTETCTGIYRRKKGSGDVSKTFGISAHSGKRSEDYAVCSGLTGRVATARVE